MDSSNYYKSDTIPVEMLSQLVDTDLNKKYEGQIQNLKNYRIHKDYDKQAFTLYDRENKFRLEMWLDYVSRYPDGNPKTYHYYNETEEGVWVDVLIHVS